MNDNNLLIEIFSQIETIEEYNKVCANFNYLIATAMVIEDSPFLRLLSIMTFRKLNNLNNHGD